MQGRGLLALLIAVYIYAMVTKRTYGQLRDTAAGYGCKTDKRLNSIIIMHRHNSFFPWE
jgi:hypothetical protein